MTNMSKLVDNVCLWQKKLNFHFWNSLFSGIASLNAGKILCLLVAALFFPLQEKRCHSSNSLQSKSLQFIGNTGQNRINWNNSAVLLWIGSIFSFGVLFSNVSGVCWRRKMFETRNSFGAEDTWYSHKSALGPSFWYWTGCTAVAPLSPPWLSVPCRLKTKASLIPAQFKKNPKNKNPEHWQKGMKLEQNTGLNSEEKTVFCGLCSNDQNASFWNWIPNLQGFSPGHVRHIRCAILTDSPKMLKWGRTWPTTPDAHGPGMCTKCQNFTALIPTIFFPEKPIWFTAVFK